VKESYQVFNTVMEHESQVLEFFMALDIQEKLTLKLFAGTLLCIFKQFLTAPFAWK
jgi:hypothetical protein